MLRPAQCEKAVTISELMWRPHRGPGVPMGSKIPIDLGVPVTGSLDPRVCASSCSCLSPDFSPIFNGLQAEKAGRGRLFGHPALPIQDGNFISIRGARFGPNFVTIQPIGVCVCSV